MSSLSCKLKRGGMVLLAAVFAAAIGFAFAGDAYAATKTSKLTLYYNSATQASKTLKAKGLTAKKAKWSTSSKKVATITKTGKVTVKKAGKATIKAVQGKNTYKFVVTSKAVSINKTKATVKIGKTLQLKLTGDKIKSVKSSATAVATVSKTGKVTAKGYGASTITLTSKKGKKYTCKVTVPDERDKYAATFGATVTDAGQYVDRMTIDYGSGVISGVDKDTYTVYMTSTVDYGAAKGNAYAYYDASKPLEVVKIETSGSKVTVYFKQDQAPTLTWLGEGRNYPGILGFTVEQNKDIPSTAPDGRAIAIKASNTAYTCNQTSFADLEDTEVTKFENVQDTINYAIHKGTNDKLIVWFHGNGEGDFPTKDTNNNVAQLLANRGGVAWTSEEAQAVFGDATVMAFQAPNMWYFAVADDLLTPCYEEIQKVIAENNIDPNEVYLSGCSAGGFMSTRMIIAYPDLFKAAMINCPALDAANARSNTTNSNPTDEELAQLKYAKTAIWLVQGETDSSVDPELCAKRVFKILAGVNDLTDASLTATEVGGTAGLASDFTTYETSDGRYKLSLYKTTDLGEVTGISGEKRQGGKLCFAEDYDLNGTYEQVKYSDHWSWIYTLRNNPEDASGTHIWQWAVNATPRQRINVAGSYAIHVQGYDYGAGVDYATLTFDTAIADLDAADLVVTETKQATNWMADGFPVEVSDFQREVTGVELAADGMSAKVSLACDPNNGSPLLYSMATGYNTWSDPYQLTFSLAKGATVASGDAAVATLDISGNPTGKTTSADEWTTDSYTTVNATNNVTFNYAAWDPQTTSDTLVVWLHGAGEGGKMGEIKTDPYVTILANKVVALSEDGFQTKIGGAHIVAPQCPTMWMDIDGNGTYINTENSTEVQSYYTESLEEFIDYYATKVNATKVVLAGCSNGGFMTLWMGLHRPDRYAAIVPICEAVPDALITDEQIQGIKDLPMYFVYSEDDDTVKPADCEIPTIQRLLTAGAKNLHVSTTEHVLDTSDQYKDADGNPYKYSGHWSWIYFDNDECADADGHGAWDFIADAVK